jgi:hypothetical protein
MLRDRLTALADQHLVPYWRNGWHFLSVRAAMLQAAVLLAWAQMPDDLKTALPGWLMPAIAGFVLLVGTCGAFFNQKALMKDKPDA